MRTQSTGQEGGRETGQEVAGALGGGREGENKVINYVQRSHIMYVYTVCM